MSEEHKHKDDNEAKRQPTIAVLLLHGLTGMPSEMRPLAKHLEKMGCRVEVPQLAGHGAGHKELLATTWKDWVAGAQSVLDKLTTESDFVFVGGLSMGSSIAAMLAKHNPRVSGIVFLSTTLRYDGRVVPASEVFLPLVDLAPSILGRIFYWTEEPPYGLKDERLQKFITRSVEAAKNGETGDFGLFRTYAGSLRQMSLLVAEVRKMAHQVTCPALVMHSLEDTMTSIQNATEIYARLGSKDKSIVLITGCDHVLTLDLQKNKVAQEVGAFITRVVKQSGKGKNSWIAA